MGSVQYKTCLYIMGIMHQRYPQHHGMYNC